MSAIGRIMDVCKRNNFEFKEQGNEIIISTGTIDQKKLKKVVLIAEYFEHARYRIDKLTISGALQYYDNEIAYRITTVDGINLTLEVEVEKPLNIRDIEYIPENIILDSIKQLNEYTDIEMDYYNGSVIFYISKTIKRSFTNIIELINKLLRIIDDLMIRIKIRVQEVTRGYVF